MGAFDGTYVLRVSRPGYNALDPNLPSAGLVFDSRWATFAAIHIHGQLAFPLIDVNPPASPVSQTVYHGLGFVPFVISYITFNAESRQYPGGSGGEGIEVLADANYLYVTDRQGLGGTLKYVVTRTRVYG